MVRAGKCVQFVCCGVVGQCVSTGDEEQCGGGDCGASQEEDGARPSSHPAYGHDWTHGAQQGRAVLGQLGVCALSFAPTLILCAFTPYIDVLLVVHYNWIVCGCINTEAATLRPLAGTNLTPF